MRERGGRRNGVGKINQSLVWKELGYLLIFQSWGKYPSCLFPTVFWAVRPHLFLDDELHTGNIQNKNSLFYNTPKNRETSCILKTWKQYTHGKSSWHVCDFGLNLLLGWTWKLMYCAFELRAAMMALVFSACSVWKKSINLYLWTLWFFFPLNTCSCV